MPMPKRNNALPEDLRLRGAGPQLAAALLSGIVFHFYRKQNRKDTDL